MCKTITVTFSFSATDIHVVAEWLGPQCPTLLAFNFLRILLSVHYCTVRSVDITLNGQCLPRLWCPAWCCFLQEEGEQNRTSSDVSGEQPRSSFSARGGRGSGLSLLLSPLFSLGHVHPSNTPLPLKICHLACSEFLTATCFPTNLNSSALALLFLPETLFFVWVFLEHASQQIKCPLWLAMHSCFNTTLLLLIRINT